MSHHDSRLNDAANGNDLALADAISLITGDIAAVADLITTGHEDAADNTVPTSAILIGQLARELGDAAIAWADTKRDQAQTLTQDAKTAQVAARVAEILEDQRKDDAKAQATGSDDTADMGESDPAQVAETTPATEQAEEETTAADDSNAVRDLRALEICVNRLCSVFSQAIPVVKTNDIDRDFDGFMMLLESGQEYAEMAFYLACDTNQKPFGIDIGTTDQEREAHDAGEEHADFKAFDAVRAEFLSMLHTPQQIAQG